MPPATAAGHVWVICQSWRSLRLSSPSKTPGALADPGTRYRFCTNAQHDVCNWLLRAEHTDAFCLACRHNRGIPDLSNADNVALWRKTEFAKHRLFYTLLRLRLPLTTKAEDPNGLAFDFLSDPPDASMRRVMTGHADGLITLNVAEADDPERERRRKSLREPYRTLLGHFRHEIAHYYWLHLVANSPAAEDFRRLFGDEREDYSAALQRYHGNGPPSDWGEHFITAYASAHPWEDFAETWAHYFHMIDTLETAAMFGMRLQPAMPKSTSFMAGIDFDPHVAEMDQIIDAWLPLTFALNSVNRSMGQADLYPFVLSPPVICKLVFVRDLIHIGAERTTAGDGTNALRAVVASLKRPIGSQPPGA
jgi:hypothetical protein